MSHALSADFIKEENKKFHTFVNLAIFLAIITGVELIIIYMPLPTWLVFSVLVVLSIVKFIAVILWFMHLIYDKVLLTLLFASGMAIAAGTTVALLFLMHPNDTVEKVVVQEYLAAPK